MSKTKNPLTSHLVRSWYEFHRIIGVKNYLSPKTPLWKNKFIPMISENKIFKLWHDREIRYLEQCYSNNIFMYFEQLKAEYDLSNKHFFCYLRLRAFLKKSLVEQMTPPDLTKVEELYYSNKSSRQFISRIYVIIIEECPKQNLHRSREEVGI